MDCHVAGQVLPENDSKKHVKKENTASTGQAVSVGITSFVLKKQKDTSRAQAMGVRS